jgi:hypothetical protein
MAADGLFVFFGRPERVLDQFGRLEPVARPPNGYSRGFI